MIQPKQHMPRAILASRAYQQVNAANILAALSDYKNANFSDFDRMDEFTPEW